MESLLCAMIVIWLLLGEPIGHLKTAASSIWLFVSLTHFVLESHEMSFVLSVLKFLFFSLINLVFTYLIAMPLAPIVVMFANESGFLPRWLVWFQTFDASLDSGWTDGYFVTPIPVAPSRWMRYRYRVLWLWRNPAYGFDYWPLGITYDPAEWNIVTLEVFNGTLMKFFAETKDGKHFCYCDGSIRFGWKLWWALDPKSWTLIPAEQYVHVAAPVYDQGKRLMFVFTP